LSAERTVALSLRARHAGHVGRFAVILAVSLVALLARPAAALRLQVRARTRLELTAHAAGKSTIVRGRLLDARGKSVAGSEVSVRSRDDGDHHFEQVARTDGDGRFELAVPDADWAGTLRHLEARFDGDAALGESTVRHQLDLAKASLVLELRAVERLTTAAAGLDVQVFARGDGGPAEDVELTLWVDGQLRRTLTTAGDGTAACRLAVVDLGDPGVHQLVLRGGGAARWNATTVQRQFELAAAMAVTVAVSEGGEGQPCGDERYCVAGRVTTLDGTGVAGAPVVLFIDQHQVGALVSATDGRFSGALRADELQHKFAAGERELVARAMAPKPFHEPAWSPVVRFVLTSRLPPAAVVYGGALTTLAMLAAALWWRARRRARRQLVAAEAVAAGLPLTHVQPWGESGGSGQRLRGVVLHGESARPTPAQLSLVDALGQHWVLECPNGSFDAELLPGLWHVEVLAEEHEPLRFACTLPHDGTYDGCALLPASQRAVVRGLFAGAVRRFSGRAIDWQRDTPREVEPRWASSVRRGQAAVRDSVRKVERAVYGPRTGAEEAAQVRAAIARVDEAQR
jgi:hypothetical protein